MNRTANRPGPYVLGTALIAGLLWGLLFGIGDNWSAFLYANPFKHLRLRLQGIAYVTITYCVLFALLLGLAGLIVWGVLVLLRRRPQRTELLAAYLGLGVAITVAPIWLRQYELLEVAKPEAHHITRRLLVGLAAALLGSLAGLVLLSLARWGQHTRWGKRFFRWTWLRNGVMIFFLAPLLGLLLLGVYRTWLYDLPLFRPRPTGEAATPQKPNILLITIDALRADHLGVYGYDPEISPHIDALARQGVVFDQAIAQSSWTLQSVSSFITSLYPTELQIYCPRESPDCSTTVDPLRVTIAELAQQAGYHTQAFVNNAWLQPEYGFLQGFDQAVYFREAEPFDLPSLYRHPFLRFLKVYLPSFDDLFREGHRRLFAWDFLEQEGRASNTHAHRFLRTHTEERFFLWLYYMEPHTRYNPTRPFRPLPPDVLASRGEEYWRNITFEPLGDLGPQIATSDDVKALISLYDGEIRDVDWLVGEVVAELDRLGLRDRTLIVLMADHGEEFMEHGGFTHGRTLYQEIVRVPLIFSGPLIEQPGRRISTPVALLDLLPTLADLMGVPVPAEARGQSLAPVLQGKEAEPKERPIFSEGKNRDPFDLQMVLDGGYKLLYSASRQTVELYDLRSDPEEQVNLAKVQAEVATEKLGLLQAWLERSQETAQRLPREMPPQQVSKAFQRLLRTAGY